MPWGHQVLRRIIKKDFSPVRANKARDQALLFARKPRQVGMLQEIRGMFVMPGVGDIQSDFVQSGCPAQCLLSQRILEIPDARGLTEEMDGGIFDAGCLLVIDVEARRH